MNVAHHTVGNMNWVPTSIIVDAGLHLCFLIVGAVLVFNKIHKTISS